jgi:hypothetical protein
MSRDCENLRRYVRTAKADKITYAILLPAVVLFSGVLYYFTRESKVSIKQWHDIQRAASIRPDYTGTVIPPNIAPLNFTIQEDGASYYIRVHSNTGPAIDVSSNSPKIVICEKRWHKLLNLNRGEQLYFDVYVKTNEGRWNRFSSIGNKIANEDIDSFLVYRKIHPGHNLWRRMAICQRNLENFSESVVLDNEYYKRGCVNCHTFWGNHPDKMLIGIRSAEYGSSAVLATGGTVKKIGTKFGYTSWHPSGRLAAYSVNRVGQFFHTAKSEVRDVIDLDSLLAYFLVGSETVKTTPNLSKKDRLETYPSWAPDGRYLYFCSAPILWSDRTENVPEHYDEIRYGLQRISYDIEKDQWGELETVLSAEDTGLSILEPRISPDGRWLLFCMCNYGCFPVYQRSSDLYLTDLQTSQETGQYKYRRLEINSDQSDSWHSWSSNSRWIVFSSKRDYGKFTRVYISYVDEAGKVYKPIIIPQRDPDYYDSCLKTFSVPELVTQPVKTTGEKLARVIRGSRKIEAGMPITMATPTAGKPAGYRFWGERE